MRKFIYSIILLLSFASVSASEKPTLYFFMSMGCGHCTNAVETLNNLNGKYEDDFDIVVFDVNEYDNGQLYNFVIDKFMLGAYVPVFVVGDDYAVTGYSEEVLNKAINASNNENYTDIIGEKLNSKDNNYVGYSLKVACEKKGITYYSDEVKQEVIGEKQEEKAFFEEKEKKQNSFNYSSVFLGLAVVIIFAIIVFKFN